MKMWNYLLFILGSNQQSAEREWNMFWTKCRLCIAAITFPNSLSGGQQQRVAVARAVVNNPKLILADEPTGNLDSNNGNEVMQLLSDLNELGTTVVMVTHSEHDARYSHRILRMLDGQIIIDNI
jgi:putative ABC transport system ATP-binding protein